jgi:hypothetical protein
MIAQFWFAEEPPPTHISLQLTLIDGEPYGRVYAPPDVVSEMLERDMPARQEDEFIWLPLALGYAVTMSGITSAALTLTGDLTAWPQDWGILSERSAFNRRSARSH